MPHQNPAPSVTVVIATYHWSSVLRLAMTSVLGQTFTDFELLVVGDGCSDDSQAVAESVGDARVRWINLPLITAINGRPTTKGFARRAASSSPISAMTICGFRIISRRALTLSIPSA